MGRRKVEIKRIQDKNCRQVAFCKRRKGLLKKAKEISILCDVDVAVVIISNRGRLHEFSSNNSLSGMLQRYESHVEAEKEINAEIQVAEFSNHFEVEIALEILRVHNNGRTATNNRKTHLMLECAKDLHEKEKLLQEEKKHLEDNIASIKKNTKVNEMSDLPAPHIFCGQQRVTLNFL
ncbi:truncated transcription factor CAULIFLOWER D-like isoform X5 [Solanum tuberosum]|uniref:truncated transcription factor CAULIFLOWER D-like isoform X5 n=1 Tax=Solanum tuberosum TaxID=4113 RepID=UPI00073A1795|nr:PREDICTED: truncated transcription factor CAULIFLOWER D-like isoform X5 [Solanum tuberosum]